MVTMVIRCQKCNRKYRSNPDVGKNLMCPYCLGTGIVMNKGEALKQIVIRRQA